MKQLTQDQINDALQQKVFMAIPQHELGRYVAFEVQLDRIICGRQTMKQRVCGIYIANSQNAMARMFLETDFEYFWLLNDDQSYPPDTLLKLLSHKKDVVVPLCLEKAYPHYPLIYGKDREGLRSRLTLNRGVRGLQLLPEGACGGGGTLIHRRVLEAIPDPWWTVTTSQAANGSFEQSSEDFDFCDRVTQAGFEIYCDYDAPVVHMALYGLCPMFDEATQEWRTALLREDETVVIPAAQPLKPSPIVITPSMPQFKQEYWKQKTAQGRA